MDSSGSLFKSVKKRKFIRKRPAEDSPIDAIPTPAEGQPAPSALPSFAKESAPASAAEQGGAASATSDTRQEDGHQEEDEDIILTDILRRKAYDRRRKALGIEFTPESGSAEHSRPPSSLALTKHGEGGDDIPAIGNRFVAHTGQKVDVDEHMYV